MAINSYFFNALQSGGVYDRIYNAEDVTSYLDLLVGNGVFPNPSTQLQVRASSGMNVVIGAGSGWINGHKMVNTSDLVMAVTASDVLLNRIDLVVFYVDYTERTMGIEIKEGTLASNPESPALVRNTTRYEMALARISVAKQVTAITDAMITDLRGNSAMCGFVQGLLQQIDTTTLWTQQQTMFNEWFESVKSQFVAAKAFRKVEGIATSSANQSVFNVLTYVPTFANQYDVLEVYINGLHLNGNEYTLEGNTVTLTTPIEKAGAVVTFEVFQSYDPDNT
jgi:hypothetical protein